MDVDRTPETPPSTPPTPNAETLSDIFSDSPSALHTSAEGPSDIPRLRSTHTTAGYREGIDVSKQKAIQAGFDEGFSLGATFGLRVGYLLGLLDAIYNAAISSKEVAQSDATRLRNLRDRSRQELVLEALFGKAFWGEDGLWKYDIGPRDNMSPDAEESTVFHDIIESHPLIKKWATIASDEAESWKITQSPWSGLEWELGRT